MKISQLASLVHVSLPAQATPVARQILLLQVETRGKKSWKVEWGREIAAGLSRQKISIT